MHMASNVRDNIERSRFELDADGHVAFSNYSRTGNVLTIRHTEVPKELEGHGIGSALIRGVLDIARSPGAEGRSGVSVREGLYRTASGICRFAAVRRPFEFKAPPIPGRQARQRHL